MPRRILRYDRKFASSYFKIRRAVNAFRRLEREVTHTIVRLLQHLTRNHSTQTPKSTYRFFGITASTDSQVGHNWFEIMVGILSVKLQVADKLGMDDENGSG